MVAQAREPSKVTCLQAGSTEAQSTLLYDVNFRVARDIGRQLAEIGDQLDQQRGSSRVHARLRLLPDATPARFLARTALFGGILTSRWDLNAVPTVIRGWIPLVRRHPGQATTGSAASVSCVRSIRLLLAVGLLVAVAVWINF
ncbi:hypothetical protein Z043_115122 [Scleropages formosus]|uniref:Uncharacterized protein n=1 Tax=Scleropages formosus TaxID=113540 RepID=A0A0P7UER9_SCLFO|nr:hypothetical protein Z043_115122 [Scleropages formosus]